MEVHSYLSKSHARRKKRRKYIAIGVACLVAYLLLMAAFWFVYRSPIFNVQQITVSGNADVASSDVVAVLQSAALENRNFFKELLGFGNMLLWPSTLPAKDLSLIPQAQSVAIVKNYFFRTITVDVTERTAAGVWCMMPEDNCYWFDGNGTIFQKAFDTQGDLLLSVHDYSGASLGLGKPILPATFIPSMMSILSVVKASGVNVQEIVLTDLSLDQINVTTHNGPTLYFSLRFPADEDLAVLQSLMAKSNFNKLQYVDFTVENRAYYK